MAELEVESSAGSSLTAVGAPPPPPPPAGSPSHVRAVVKPPTSAALSARTYSLRPAFQHKFRSSIVKDCIHETLKEMLTNVQYNPEDIPSLTKLLSETIRDRLKERGFHRYKIIVQVVIGEQRGEGVNMAARCFWDADTDNYAQDVFMNSWGLSKSPLAPQFEDIYSSVLVGLIYVTEQQQFLYVRKDSLFCVAVAFGCFFY